MAIMKEIKAYISATATLNSTQYKIFTKMKKILLQKCLGPFYVSTTYRCTEAMA